MNRIIKFGCSILAVAFISVCFFACNGKSKKMNFNKIFNDRVLNSVPKQMEIINLPDGAVNVSFQQDYAIYDKGDLKNYVYDLTKRREIIEGNANITRIVIEDDIIVVDEKLGSVEKRTFFNKDGRKYLDFSKELLGEYRALKDDLFIVNKDLYRGNRKIISGNSNTDIYNYRACDGFILYKVLDSYISYDFNGKIIASFEINRNSGQNLYFINNSVGLIMTISDLHFMSKDYTCSINNEKKRIIYEKIDFKTGKRKKVNINYYIDSLVSLANNNGIKEKARTQGMFIGRKINKDKTVMASSSVAIINSKMKITEEFPDMIFAEYINKDRIITYSVNGYYSVIDSNNKLIAMFTGHDVQKLNGFFFIGDSYPNDGNWFNIDGKLIIEKGEYLSVDNLSEEFFLATKRQENNNVQGLIDALGNFRAVPLKDSQDSIEFFSKLGIYIYLASDGKKCELIDFNGKILYEFNPEIASLKVKGSYRQNDYSAYWVIEKNGKESVLNFQYI